MQHDNNLAFNDNRDHNTHNTRATRHRVDMAVGRRIRNRRLELGLSQAALGDEISVTFQQIQKYEKGTNRVSASALYEIARVLGVPLTFFFDRMADIAPEFIGTGDEAATARLAYACTKEGERLVDLFQQVPPLARKHLLGVMMALVERPVERPTENAVEDSEC